MRNRWEKSIGFNRRSTSRVYAWGVDDDQISWVVATRHLTQMGCQTEEAVNGQQAVDMFRPGKYNLILMDPYMPEMDGYSASCQIRRIEQTVDNVDRILILALRVSVFEGVWATCQEAGIDDHLGKPFKISKLASKIEHLLAGSPSLASSVFTPSSALADDPASLLFNSQQLQQIALEDLDFLLEVVGSANQNAEERLT